MSHYSNACLSPVCAALRENVCVCVCDGILLDHTHFCSILMRDKQADWHHAVSSPTFLAQIIHTSIVRVGIK